ncbi:MAG: TOBE domain-containing protein, partial [Pseudomonadota bacterium]
PEKFSLSGDQPTADLAVEGRLSNTAYLGERSHYYIKVPGKEDPIAVSSTNFDRVSGGSNQDDAPVWLSWSPDSVVILDAD